MFQIATPRKRALRSLTPLFAAILAACGGGGGSDTTSVSTKVIDGAIGNATVCLDKNANGTCDTGEPSGKTNTAGEVTLSVDKADAGKYALIALVGTDAVDADHGPVSVPYVMSTPADKPGLITPLTTLVQVQATSAGLSTVDAEKALQDQLNVSGSMFADYTAAGGSATLASLARLVTIVRQQVYDSVDSAIGTTDSSGGTITQQDLQRAIDGRLVGELQAVAAALGSDAVRNATDAQALEAALQAQAQSLAAANVAIDPTTAVGGAKVQATATPAPSDNPPAASFSLRWFTYTDASNWFYRSFASTLAQATPDANGKTYYTEARKRAVGGVVQNWGDAADFTQANRYWTGTEWFLCPVDHVHSGVPFDANGESQGLYCDSFLSKSRRLGRDISGLSITSIVTEIRAYPEKDTFGNTFGGFPAWGPDPALPALAGQTFPAGSKLYYQTGIDLDNPYAYNPAATNQVTALPESWVNSLRADAVATCAAPTPGSTPVTTLEDLVARFPGIPCTFTPNSSTGPRNESWGATVVSLGSDVAAPVPDGNTFYSPVRRLAVAFGSGNAVTYYRCLRRAVNPSTRNCDVIGTGTYTIESKGDGRTMRFSDLPPDTAQYNTERVFVEREGAVYFGFRNKLRASTSIRLNDVATDALFGALGISR
jgi:hypothetical protein